MSKYAFFFGLFVVAVLIFSLYRAKYGASESAAEIAAVETQIAAAKARQTELRTELAHRSRQEWIEEYARKELGMVPARAEQFLSPEELDARIGPAIEPQSPEGSDLEARDD